MCVLAAEYMKLKERIAHTYYHPEERERWGMRWFASDNSAAEEGEYAVVVGGERKRHADAVRQLSVSPHTFDCLGVRLCMCVCVCV